MHIITSQIWFVQTVYSLTYAVHVVLKGTRQVHVDHVADALHIQTSAGDICGY
jgi:hypothetical protein